MSTTVQQPPSAPTRRRQGRATLAVSLFVVADMAATAVVFSAAATPPAVRVERAIWLVLVAALLWIASSQGSRLLTAVSSVALGLAGVVVGAAVTAPHMIKTGTTPLLAAGLLALAASVVLTVIGAHRVTSGITTRWRRYLALAAGTVALLYLVAPVAVAVYVTNPPPTSTCCRTPNDLGLPYQDLRLTTSDGVRLAAWYVPSHNGAAVILLHGSGESRENTLDHAAVLVRHGYGTLMLDARGHGDSDGRALDLGWAGAKDVEAGVSYLARRPDVTDDRIAVLGLSLGAEEGLTAATADPRIRAVVAEGAGMRTYGDAQTAITSTGAVALPAEWISFFTTQLLTSEDPPIPLASAMKRIAPRPVLLISGSDGQENDLNRAYATAAGPSTQWWPLPDTAHTQALTTHRSAYEQKVLAFLDAALRAGP